MQQRPILCPRCQRVIGSADSTCPWCGASRPAFPAPRAWLDALGNGDRPIACIVAVNIVFYILSMLLSARHTLSLNPLYLFSPDRTSLLLLGATGTIPVLRLGRIWTLLSANYLHGGILHIFFNLMALRQIGPWVTQEFGPSRMFIIYTLGGVGGFVISVAAGIPFTIGASAAICALIGALLFFGKSRGGSYGAAVYREVSGWVISLAVFGFIVPGINNWGHAGGIVSGIVLGKIVGYQELRQEGSFSRLVALACAFTTVAVLILGALSALSYLKSSGVPSFFAQ